MRKFMRTKLVSDGRGNNCRGAKSRRGFSIPPKEIGGSTINVATQDSHKGLQQLRHFFQIRKFINRFSNLRSAYTPVLFPIGLIPNPHSERQRRYEEWLVIEIYTPIILCGDFLHYQSEQIFRNSTFAE